MPASITVRPPAAGAAPVLLVRTPPCALPPALVFATAESGTKRKHYAIAAETDAIAYSASTADTPQPPCRYLVGEYDSASATLQLREARVCELHVEVKKQRVAPEPVGEKNYASRSALGQAFGTKKTKQMIRAIEQNTVRVDSMSGAVTTHIEDKIDARTEASSPLAESKESYLTESQQTDIIPPYNAQAAAVADIYSVRDMVPELDSIPVKHLLSLGDKPAIEQALGALRFSSKYVVDSIADVLGAAEKNKRQLRVLLYLAYLLKFRTLKFGKLSDAGELSKALNSAPLAVCESMLGRFTEEVQDAFGKKRFQITAKKKDKIVCYALVLILHLEAFRVDVSAVAEDLKMPVQKVSDLFRSVGCRVSQQRKASPGENGGSTASKVAILSLPLQFPKPLVPGRRRR